MSERRKAPRYAVNWPARILLADRSLFNVSVQDVSAGGLAIMFDQVLSINTPINIEFFVAVGSEKVRIRAKTRVAHQSLLSNGMARLGLLFIEMTGECAHKLGNILQELADKQSPL